MSTDRGGAAGRRVDSGLHAAARAVARVVTGVVTGVVGRFAVLGAVLGTAWGCGGAGGVDPQEPPPFPVRLLPPGSVATTPEATVLPFDDLSAWWVLEGESLVPARDHVGVTLGGEGPAPEVTMVEGTTLVRLITLPPAGFRLLEVQFAPAAAARNGHASPGPWCFPIQTTDDGATLAEMVASQRVLHPAGAVVALGQRVATVFAHARVTALCEWSRGADQNGWARAHMVFAPDATARVYAVVVSTQRGPLSVRGVRITSKPRGGATGGMPTLGATAESTATTATAVAVEVEADGRRSVTVGRELRPSLVVPPGRRRVVPLSLPAGATHIDFGVAWTALLPAGNRARWTVAVIDADGAETTLGAADAVLPPQPAPAWPWRDVSLAWPDAVPSERATAMVFAVSSLPEGADGGESPELAFGAPTIRGPVPRRGPNLLFLSLDTLRADRLGFMGYHRPTSPRLDALVDQAVVFDEAWSPSPFTLPTHVTLFTGLSPLRHGVNDGATDRMDAQRLAALPLRLAQAGFATAAFTGGGFVSSEYGFAEGFDRFSTIDPVVHRPTGAPVFGVEAATAWIEARDDERWFAFVHTYATHDYDPPAADRARFDTAPTAVWGRDPKQLQAYLHKRAWPGDPPDAARLEQIGNVYDATVAMADRRVGDFLEGLAATGRLRDTLVVITSDHGDEFFEHAGLLHGNTVYREMLHVPLMLFGPGVARGVRVTRPVSQVDVMPTVLDLLGLTAAAALDGRSLTSLMVAGAASADGDPQPVPILGHVDNPWARRTTLRLGDWSVIRGDVDPALPFPAPRPWELFDLATDPGQQVDLSARHPDRLQSLQDALAQIESELRPQGDSAPGVVLSEAVAERLRQLGYR